MLEETLLSLSWYITSMAYEVEVSDEFKAWYEKGGQSLAPVDWLETHTPYRWQADASSHHLDERYDWLQPEGALPFEV